MTEGLEVWETMGDIFKQFNGLSIVHSDWILWTELQVQSSASERIGFGGVLSQQAVCSEVAREWGGSRY